MKTPGVLLLTLAVLTRGAAAQAVATMREVWAGPIGFVTQAAEQVPESLYAYRPTASVRSFGQLIGHVAGAQYLICAAALGEAGRSEDDIEKSVTTKTGLVAALKASTAYCEKAYAQTDAAAQQHGQLFGQDRTRLFMLGINAAHNDEHYGNIVTYMRINRMVPPSSQPPQ